MNEYEIGKDIQSITSALHDVISSLNDLEERVQKLEGKE